MLADTMDASAAAYHVGYVSRPQFSREYSRLFRARRFVMWSRLASTLKCQVKEVHVSG